MSTHKLKLQLCPNCGHKLDAASNADPLESTSGPKPGDCTVWH
jgi:hypothetical protein